MSAERATGTVVALKAPILARFPRVYPIVDTVHLNRMGVDPIEMAESLATAGVRIAQYRHKGAFTRARFAEARAVGAVFRRAGVCYILNDRADVALALGADGVHVGQEDLPPKDVRRLIGHEMLLGYSTHNAAQLCSAECRWADYLAIGPVFGTVSKQNPDPVVGLHGVRHARSMTDKPLVAIGGIALESAANVISAGADSLSVISSLTPENLPQWMPMER